MISISCESLSFEKRIELAADVTAKSDGLRELFGNTPETAKALAQENTYLAARLGMLSGPAQLLARAVLAEL